MRTTNPALSAKTFTQARPGSGTMSISGTINKSFVLIVLVLVSATWSWQQAFPGGYQWGQTPSIPMWYIPAIIGALIVAMIIIFKQTTAPYLAPVYALLEGVALGAISAFFEYRYPGIVLQAVLCTIGTFTALLIAYRSGLIKVTENFKLGVAAATGGIFLVYMLSFIMGFFGVNIPFIHEGGPIGIAFSVAVIVIASLNLVLDFDFIEQGSAQGAPKYMEWYASFGLLVTLVWLYLEFLRLLSKLRSR